MQSFYQLLELCRPLLASFVSPQCADVYVVQHDFFNAACFRVLFSRALGYGIIFASVFLMLPQVLKIFPSGNTQGLAVSSYILSVIGYTINFAYFVNLGYHFSTWGESSTILVQLLFIVFLLCYYRGQHKSKEFFFGAAIYAAFTAVLFSGLVSHTMLGYLFSAAIPIFIASKFPQIWENFKNGSTGSLSFITTLLQLAGQLARVLTTVQECWNDPQGACARGDVFWKAVLGSILISVVLNSILVGQILYYWSRSKEACNQCACASTNGHVRKPSKKDM